MKASSIDLWLKRLRLSYSSKEVNGKCRLNLLAPNVY